MSPGVRAIVAIAVWPCACLPSVGEHTAAGEKPAAAQKPAGEGPAAPYRLASTASDEVTARVDAHLKTQFARYQTLLPPRVRPAAPPTIELFGLLEEYRSALGLRNLSIVNPACFIASGNVVLLGFDGARYDAGLKSLRDRAERLRKQDRELTATLNDKLKVDEARYVDEGKTLAAAQALTRGRLEAVKKATAKFRRELKQTEQSLAGDLAEATARLFEAASHEAFHAYAANYVYPPSAGGLPRWLDEGLAQAVEHGTWPGNKLQTARKPGELLKRIAAAQAARGAAGDRLFDLRAVLEAESSQFVLPGSTTSGDEAAQDAADAYLAAWSLTQYLLGSDKLKPGEQLDRYVADRDTAAVARFEKWQQRKIDEIQRDWRAYYLSGATAR